MPEKKNKYVFIFNGTFGTPPFFASNISNLRCPVANGTPTGQSGQKTGHLAVL